MTEVIVFFACLVIAYVFCRVFSRLPEDVAKDLDISDSGEPPNLRDAKACRFCLHAKMVGWDSDAYCEKFDYDTDDMDVCDGFER